MKKINIIKRQRIEDYPIGKLTTVSYYILDKNTSNKVVRYIKVAELPITNIGIIESITISKGGIPFNNLK